jgi:hypothetical protein
MITVVLVRTFVRILVDDGFEVKSALSAKIRGPKLDSPA